MHADVHRDKLELIEDHVNISIDNGISFHNFYIV